jgi:hypothetical protein
MPDPSPFDIASAANSAAASVSALLFAHNLTTEAADRLSKINALVDEFVIFLDSEKVTGKTRELAERISRRIFETPGGNMPEIRAEMVARCAGKWILRIDSDEELSPEWSDVRWHDLLKTEFTHFYFPRRWMTSRNQFLQRAPWWPDFSMRLFRRDSVISFPANVHNPMRVLGRGGYCRHLAIHHHVLHMLSRAEREEKTRAYELLRPGGAKSHYYLFEDHSILSTAVPPSDRFDASRELLRMERELDGSDLEQVSIAVSGLPTTIAPEEVFWVRVVISNRGSHPLCSGSPHPVNLSYHWLEANSRRPVLFECHRTRLFPGVGPQNRLKTELFVRAPAQEGRLVLQVTLVQEGVGWLEEKWPEIVQEAEILVER